MKNRRSGLGALLAFLVSLVLCGTAGATPPTPFTLVDTLGAATPETVFPLVGTGGIAISPGQWVGPQFTITRNTTITEIGAFIAGSSAGVQIRPSVDGIPDSTVVIADLSIPACPFQTICYVSVTPEKNSKVKLKPGVYFAIFTATPDQSGYLLSNLFPTYQAGSTTLGFILPMTGAGLSFTATHDAAVRVLGK